MKKTYLIFATDLRVAVLFYNMLCLFKKEEGNGKPLANVARHPPHKSPVFVGRAFAVEAQASKHDFNLGDMVFGLVGGAKKIIRRVVYFVHMVIYHYRQL